MSKKQNSRIYVPTKAPDDWQSLLAEPNKQWRTGFSALTLAYCWESAKGFPPEVENALNTIEVLAHPQLLAGYPRI